MEINLITPQNIRFRAQWSHRLQTSFDLFGDKWHISTELDNSDLHVFWGLKNRIAKSAIETKSRFLVVERAYLGDRINKWQSFGFDGLNGYANFCNQNVEPDRWQKYWKDQMQSWNPKGEYALLIGQVQGDASLRGIDQHLWAQEIAKELKAKYRKVVYRKHPDCRQKKTINGCYIDTQPLSESLKNAKVVITYNSNVGVDAIMAGKPVIAYDKGSMVYEISSHNIEEDVIMPDREDWGRKIAYAQWLPEETEEAWAHLRKFVI